MADPTIEEDLALVKRYALAGYGENVSGQLVKALDRVAAALREREHLELGAGLYATLLELRLVSKLTNPTADMRWLERERARKQGSGDVVKSTP